MPRARVAVVGLGNMGRRHARTVEEMPEVELVGLLDPAHKCDSYGGSRSLPDLRALGNLDLDYCVIATPTVTHLPLARDIAQMGISFLVEKPVADSTESAQAINQEVTTAQVIARVGHVERFNPAIRAAKTVIESGQMGQVVQVVSHRQGPNPGRITDVGVALDLATHDLDLVTWMMGSRYRDLTAKLGSLPRGTREDYVITVGELESGAIVSHTVNWICPFKERKMMIYGTQMVMKVDLLAMDVDIFPGDRALNEWESVAAFRGAVEGGSTRLAIHRQEPLVLEHRHMLLALSGEPDDCASLADGQYVVSTIETLLAARQGLNEGP